MLDLLEFRRDENARSGQLYQTWQLCILFDHLNKVLVSDVNCLVKRLHLGEVILSVHLFDQQDHLLAQGGRDLVTRFGIVTKHLLLFEHV